MTPGGARIVFEKIDASADLLSRVNSRIAFSAIDFDSHSAGFTTGQVDAYNLARADNDLVNTCDNHRIIPTHQASTPVGGRLSHTLPRPRNRIIPQRLVRIHVLTPHLELAPTIVGPALAKYRLTNTPDHQQSLEFMKQVCIIYTHY